MNATSFPLRPFLAADTERLQDLFAQSIELLTAEDYDEDERLAWIARAADAQAFQQRLARNTTILVEQDGEILGFASLEGKETLDMLYVHPYAVAQGVGSALLDAMERIAKARGAETMSVDASDTAHDFFAARGYQGMRRNTIPVDVVWLTNTTMTKSLKAPAGSGEASESRT